MKYAIIEISGRQFWVEPGKYYIFNRLDVDQNEQILLNRILLLNNNGKVFIGKPYLKNVKITGRVLEHIRGKKIIVYKMKQKKKMRQKQGHRQEMTKVLVEAINIHE